MSINNEKLLLKIYEELKDTKEQLKEIPEIKKNLDEVKEQVKEIPEIKEQVKEIPEIKEQVKEIPKIKKQLEEIPKIKKQLEEIPKMKWELRSISGSVARIEVEHGEKLVALFDAFKVNTEKIEEQNKRIARCEKTLDSYNDKIYLLNSKIKNS